MNRRAVCTVMLLFGACARAGVENLDARLAALTPADPMGYFLLAEEVAYEAADADEKRLATRLFVLSHLLDERAGGAHNLARSVALALADLESAPADRRWLLALAEMLDPRASETQWDDATTDPEAEALRFTVAEALGQYMAGRYREAEEQFDKPGVRDVAQQFARLLPGGLSPIDAVFDSVPTCRECHNRRIVRSRTDPDGAPALCYTCGGDPGPRLPDGAILQHLVVQSLLLGASGDSWAAQAAAGRTQPLRAVDTRQLGALYAVSADRPYYREGEWVEDPGSTPPPPQNTMPAVGNRSRD